MVHFSKKTIKFYKDLKENNNREWFTEHKQDYLDYIQQPSIELVTEVGKQLQKVVPGISYDTTTNGSGSIMRIYRDVRFSKDKTPYKTWHGIRFWEGLDHKNTISRFFFYVNDQGGGIYVGNHGFDRDELLAYQKAVDNDKQGEQLEKLVKKLSKHYEVGTPGYKNVPKAFAKDHPRGELLKYKSLYAHTGDISIKDVTSDQLVDIIVKHFKALAPLHQWLNAII